MNKNTNQIVNKGLGAPKDSKKAIISWSLYDWANSAFATTVMAGFFPVFFNAYWAVGPAADLGTFYLGLANSLASLVVAALAPMLGSIADRGSYKKKFLIFFIFLGSIMTGALWMVGFGQWQLAVIFYIVATVGFSGGNTFYDSLLPSVASEKKVDFVSALGYSLGYIGGGLLFLVNVLMYLMPTKFGLADDVQAIKVSFLIVAIWWLVFSLPLILFIKEPKEKGGIKIKDAVKGGFKDLAETFRSLKTLKVTGLFLLAYWFYIDGVDSIIRMAVNYGTNLGFDSSSLIIALLITQFVAFPAALAYNWFGKWIGNKNAILVAIASYIVITIFGVFMTVELHFYLLAVAIGLFQGGIQALSRSYYSRLIPANKDAQFYGFFNMLGKFAAIIGPLLIGIVSALTGSERLSILSLIILFAAGGVLLFFVDENKAKENLKDWEKLNK